MLIAYALEGRRLVPIEKGEGGGDLKRALWIDLISPTTQERQRVKKVLGQSLVMPSEGGDIEASARFFENKEGLHVRSFFFYEDKQAHASNITVTFTIRDGRLFTVRERDFLAFRLYRRRACMRSLSGGNAYELLLDLLETKIEQLADAIENIYSALERLSKRILEDKQSSTEDESLARLAALEDSSSKVQIGLMDTQRALNFLMRKDRIPPEQLEQAREMLRDIESVLPHNESLFQRINFLLQAAMGFIDLEQNRIMKILSFFSIAAILPMFITGVYGMNLVHMPFLHSPCAPVIIGAIMAVSAIIPALFFKRIGWW